RNDFVILKAAYDRKTLYFFAQTLNPISPRTDPHWMLLLLDSDQNPSTGWLGYDFVVNLEVPTDTQTTVKAWRGGDSVTTGRASYRVNGNGMEIAVPRRLVGQTKDPPGFDFHWADNLQRFGDASDLGLGGDSAPDRRFNYRFCVRRGAGGRP